MRNPSNHCVAIMGATATGKSALGVLLARRFGGEVVSMDSRQVYRGMDIGTGKIALEQRGGVPHHLLDVLEPSQRGSAGSHAELARQAIREISERGRLPLLVGGTGLYFDAVFRPFIDLNVCDERVAEIRAGFEGRETDDLFEELRRVDAERAAQLSAGDRVRITRALEVFLATGVPMSAHFKEQATQADADGFEPSFLKLVLTMPRQALRERIVERTRAMYAAGWVDEVKRLLSSGYNAGSPGMRSLGYEEIAAVLGSGGDAAATVDAVITRTHQYAKRQETYFRKEASAVWLDVTDPGYPGNAVALVKEFLKQAQ
jgi:tRNA dimethylallyltransferase